MQSLQGQLPDLCNTFRPEEIDWLLAEEITCLNVCLGCDIQALSIIDFAIGSSYEDRLEQPLPLTLLRVTPLHAFEVNYVDDKGLTHFRIACMTGCDHVVRKFLELGQDPDCIWPQTGDSPLHLAVNYSNRKVVETLLR
ncbi:hypothetical protein TKK_0017575 [Trichogramma kaykai]